MPLEARGLTGLALALAVAYWATPVAIRVADRLDFYDRPAGYKGHGRPTPYLGGAAVMVAFVLAVVALTGDWSRTLPLIGGVVLLWALGTVDDRRTVSPGIRVMVEVALAALLWALGHHWDTGLGGLADLIVSAVWIVAVVNAFNLFDNMDGAAGSMAAVVAAAVGVLGVVEGDVWLSVTAAALCGACIGFLPYNLASPARIFLGDGGSMPIGFAVAALVMIGAGDAALEWQALAVGLLLVGVPALDTALVVVSRRRRGVSILTGGRDHLTHRTRARLETARAVALTLGSIQATISALAIVALQGGSGFAVLAVAVYLVGIGVAIALLDGREVTPADGPASVATDAGGPRWGGYVPLALVVPLGLAIGLSPFAAGFYDSSIWVPGGLVLVAVTTAALIANPPPLTTRARVALLGIGGMGLLAITSSLWADSVEQAVIEGNRLLVYAMVLGTILVFVRSRRMAIWLLAAIAGAAMVVAASVVARLLGDDPGGLLLLGRLSEPLGYINGQGSFFLLAFWICIAAAAQRRAIAPAAAGLGSATALACLMLLSQSRGVAVALAASAVVVLALLPGRLRVAWALLTAGAGVGLAGPRLLDVYRESGAGELADSTGHAAGTAIILAAFGTAAVWGLVLHLSTRAPAGPGRLAAAAVLAVGCLAAAGVAIAEREALSRTISAQYAAFVQVGEGGITSPPRDTSTRLASGAGNRYDYWRVAWRTFRAEPILGVGAGNYDGPYFRERATTEDVRQPHSIQLQALSELGLLGGALLVLVLGAFCAGAWRLARSAASSAGDAFVATAAVGILSAWLVHTSVDWIHLLPGVTAIALVAAALMLRARGPAPSPSRARAAGPAVLRRLGLAVAVAVLLALAAASLSRQGLAEHFRGQAQAALAADPERALVDADRSLRLDREAVPAYYVKAAALARYGEADAARATLLEAARREPRDFVTWALLGDLSVRERNFDEARAFYSRALALNPRDPTLRVLARDPAAALSAPASG